jgi:hypothetical protein
MPRSGGRTETGPRVGRLPVTVGDRDELSFDRGAPRRRRDRETLVCEADVAGLDRRSSRQSRRPFGQGRERPVASCRDLRRRVITEEESPTDEPTTASREGATSPVVSPCRDKSIQGEEREDPALFGDRRQWVGRSQRRTSALVPSSPRPAGRRRGAHRRGRRSGPTNLGRVPLRPCSPRASARESSSWPRGRRHVSSGLGRPISSAIDRPSLWRSSSRTLRLAFPPRRPPPPALLFFNGEGTPATGRVADPEVSGVPPRQNDPRRTLVRASLASVPVRTWRPGHPLGLDVRQALMTRTPRPVTHLDASPTNGTLPGSPFRLLPRARRLRLTIW